MKGVFYTELREIEQHILSSKYKESLKKLDGLLNRNELLEEEIIQAKILKARIFLDIQPFSEALTNAKQAYESSVKIDDIFLIFDSALVYSKTLGYLGSNSLAREKTNHAIEVLEKYQDKESLGYLKRKANILTTRFSSTSEEYLDNLNHAIDISDQVEDDFQKAWYLFSKADVFLNQGNYTRSEHCYEQSLSIFTNLGYKMGIIACSTNIAAGFLQRGELDEYLRYSLKGLSYAEEIDSSYALGGIYADLGFYYWQKGELETSLQYYDKSIVQITKGKHFGNIHYIAVNFRMNLVFLEQGKYEKINQNLEKMEIVASLNSIQDRSGKYPFMLIYMLAKTIYLKATSFDDNQDEIERMLKEIVKEKLIYIEMNRLALFHLCDFYLQRLKQTNDIELIDPIKQTIDQLDKLAETQKSSILLAETYLLKSHLALIELEVEEAKVMLEKAQQIAEDKGIIRLATLISNEYDHFLEQITRWESFTTKLPNIADRMELTHLEDMMNKLVKNRISFADVSQENEDPSIFLIMDKTGHVIFSDNFEDIPLEPDVTEGIISTVHDFLEEKEHEKNMMHRLKFRTFSIVLHQSEDLILCYVFVGKSYSALKKFRKLINDIITFSNIWEDLHVKVKAKEELSLSDRTKLSDYLESIFV